MDATESTKTSQAQPTLPDLIQDVIDGERDGDVSPALHEALRFLDDEIARQIDALLNAAIEAGVLYGYAKALNGSPQTSRGICRTSVELVRHELLKLEILLGIDRDRERTHRQDATEAGLG